MTGWSSSWGTFCIVLALFGGSLAVTLVGNACGWISAVFFRALALRGSFDAPQTSSATRHNYPVIGTMCLFLEFIRPEVRQYFMASGVPKLPFPRAALEAESRPVAGLGTTFFSPDESSIIKVARSRTVDSSVLVCPG